MAAHLVREHGLSQLRAAKIAGVPQPLLNSYLHGRRVPPTLRELEKVPGFRDLVDEIARSVKEGKPVNTCFACARILALMGLGCGSAGISARLAGQG